jgi:hypothetical protein
MSIKELPSRKVMVEDLKPYPRNVKEHPTKQVEGIVKSMDEYGMTQDIVVDEENVVLIGHGRLMALKEKKVESITVKVLEGLTEERKDALRVLDNKLTISPWHKENLMEALIKADDKGLFTGFTKNEIAKMKALDEKAGNMPAFELTPMLHEKYDYVLIFFDDELDFVFAEQLFGLEKRADRFKDGTVGLCRAIRWKDAYERLKSHVRRKLENKVSDPVEG